MKLKHFVVSAGLAAVTAFSCVQAFAAATAGAPDAVVASGNTPAPSKKAIRAANRAFSKTVQKALSGNKDLGDSRIAVFGNAHTGHVTLAGQIASQDQDGVAVDAAKKVPGVTSVSSKLTLREEGGS